MAHRNARLTPLTRRELVEQVLAGWTQAEVARQFRVSRATVVKWVGRFRSEGQAGLEDRTSAPRRHRRQTPPTLARSIISLRRRLGFGPHRISWALGVARSTVYAVLRRAGLNRLSLLHRVTREPVRRYEHPRPGDPLHIDVKKLGRIPRGGGKRFGPGFAETQSGPHSRRARGVDYLHVAVDDHSRYAYVEALPDERGVSCAAFLARAVSHFGERGVSVRRVLTDNAKAYTSGVFTAAATGRGDQAELDQAVPPPDERECGALYPDPTARVGLRPPLSLQPRTAAGARDLARPLQSSSTARRHRWERPHLSAVNNLRQF